MLKLILSLCLFAAASCAVLKREHAVVDPDAEEVQDAARAAVRLFIERFQRFERYRLYKVLKASKTELGPEESGFLLDLVIGEGKCETPDGLQDCDFKEAEDSYATCTLGVQLNGAVYDLIMTMCAHGKEKVPW